MILCGVCRITTIHRYDRHWNPPNPDDYTLLSVRCRQQDVVFVVHKEEGQAEVLRDLVHFFELEKPWPEYILCELEKETLKVWNSGVPPKCFLLHSSEFEAFAKDPSVVQRMWCVNYTGVTRA